MNQEKGSECICGLPEIKKKKNGRKKTKENEGLNLVGPLWLLITFLEFLFTCDD